MTAEREPTDDLDDELYERYAKPLESEHWGEFIIIAPDGRYVLGGSRSQVLEKAVPLLGRGNNMYRLGFRYVGEALVSSARRTTRLRPFSGTDAILSQNAKGEG